MSLEQKDVELIERIIYKQGDDIAVSIARSFERLEERMDAMESRLYSRLSELEDTFEEMTPWLATRLSELEGKAEENREEIVGALGDFREQVHSN